MTASANFRRVRVIDSHTGGEPTRVVIQGSPDLGSGSLAERRSIFAAKYDGFRSAVINEPRGSDVLVGALLCKPADPSCTAGVIFFNNAGMIGMCGHGTIGVAVTLAHLGRIGIGKHRLDTPVGVVTIDYQGDNRVGVQNVLSYRKDAGVEFFVEGYGLIRGDVAWGGNWFFLTESPGIDIQFSNSDALLACTKAIRQALNQNGITGHARERIDHLELFGPPQNSGNHSRNFVWCPGGAFDRSPCGTGTSAKLACLAADGKLREGEIWRQEGILGTVFEGSFRRQGDGVLPSITGSAYICAESDLLFDPNDPFLEGIRA